MVEDRRGYLWFGTWGGGLNRFDRRTGRFKAYRHDPADSASLSHNNILSLLIDHGGTLWAGTDDGLNRLDGRTGRFTVFRPKSGLIESRWYRVLAEGADGSIWMGTYTQGLQRLDVRTGEIVTYKNDPKVQRQPQQQPRECSLVDYVGHAVGWHAKRIESFRSQYRRIRNLRRARWFAEQRRGGHPGRLSRQTVAKRPVMGCPDSIRERGRSIATTLMTAWPTTSSRTLCTTRVPKGRCTLAANGVTAFYPEKVVDSRFVPPVVLTDFLLFNNPVRAGEESVLRKSISYTDALTLSHQQNIFSIEFSSLSYANPRRNRYRYMLEPLEKTWNEVGSNQRLVTYTTLPSGRYTFRVQGSSSSGVWNVNGVSVVLTILPPWYQTNWFRASCVLAFLALVWALYQLRLRQLAAQFNMRLEERVGERTRIAHDLHDTLLQTFQGLVFRFQGALNQLPNRPEKAYEVLESALISADQALAEGRNSIQELRSELLKESNIEQMLLAAGRELASSQNGEHGSPPLRVIVEGTRRAKQTMIREEIYRIARELLRNAYRHAHARSIEAELRYDDDAFVLIVRDDGKGIDPKVLKDRGRAGHWGLRGVYERAEGIGARLDVWSEAGAGTEVRLTVPAAIAYEKSGVSGRFKLFRKTRIYEHRS